MKRLIILCSVFLLARCGSPPSSPTQVSNKTPLEPVCAASRPPVAFQTTTTQIVSHELCLGGICPDGSGNALMPDGRAVVLPHAPGGGTALAAGVWTATTTW